MEKRYTGLAIFASVGVFFLIHMVVTLSTSAKLDRPKEALRKEIDLLADRAESELVADWFDVAQDGVSDYERGLRDGFRLASLEKHVNDDAVKSVTIAYVREAIRRKLVEKGESPTPEKVNTQVESHPKVKRLNTIIDVKGELSSYKDAVHDAQSLEEIDRIRADLEANTLVRLLDKAL